jgi:hypothetical protein
MFRLVFPDNVKFNKTYTTKIALPQHCVHNSPPSHTGVRPQVGKHCYVRVYASRSYKRFRENRTIFNFHSTAVQICILLYNAYGEQKTQLPAV